MSDIAVTRLYVSHEGLLIYKTEVVIHNLVQN